MNELPERVKEEVARLMHDESYWNGRRDVINEILDFAEWMSTDEAVEIRHFIISRLARAE